MVNIFSSGKPKIRKIKKSWWIESISTIENELQTGQNGLTTDEIESRLKRYGRNIIIEHREKAAIFQFLSKFLNPLVILLLVASAISAVTGDAISFIIISLMVFISVTLDFVQEYRAGKAADKLRQSVSLMASVIRDGKKVEIPSTQIVPGDIVILSAGDLVPADGRVLESKDFFVNQSLLTGEAYPVEKHPIELDSKAIDIEDADNAVFTGTSVISGSARILIYVTGENTLLGEISDTLAIKPPPTSFETGTRDFGFLIMRMTIFLVLFVLLVNAFFHRSWLESFLFAMALAVGLTPELLPMIVSITLSRGAMKMADKKMIVKRLSSIQNLGSMDVLCTDKTGTLTQARIILEKHIDIQDRESDRVFELAYTNSFFETGLRSPLDEAILKHHNMDMGKWKKIDEVPFDFERRRVSVLVDDGSRRMLTVKGAPEDILRLSTTYEEDGESGIKEMDEDALNKLNTQFNNLSKEGFRVLAIAWKNVLKEHPHAIVTDETELVFAGFAAFLDPPKPSAEHAMAALQASGVNVKIITGDNELVTQHICASLNIPVKGVMTGAQIAAMDDTALRANVDDINLFCRMTPVEKNRIILALKKRGHVVGYMGDGINDAPALHSADIGLSVDGAVDVAKAAADMILLEQDLNVLHDGVLEGRRTFGNIMKYIMMGTSSNFGNMFSMAGASLFIPFLPMLPIQILLNNLLYDLSEIPIPADNVDDQDIAKPRPWDISFIMNFMFIIGPISSIFDFLTFYVMLGIFHASEELFHTGWFIESLATQVLVIFIIRTRGNPFKSRPNTYLTIAAITVVLLAILIPFTPLGRLLGFVPPPMLFFMILVLMVIVYLILVELVKRWFYARFFHK